MSALLHAATMVTAGVFLVIRSSLFFEYSSGVLILLCIFGSITALFSGMVASFQFDIKKIIAYSTCSQLGYMFFSCGLSNYHVAFFHLFNHAFFKALLFLSAGALIHSLFDEQDIRRMGDLSFNLPFIYISFLVGSLAILGTPFLSGFYSKDVILELVYSRYILDSFFVYFLAVFAALLTSTYSFKLFYFVFFSQRNYSYTVFKFWRGHSAENWDSMYFALFFLIFLSISSGFLFNDMFLGYGSNFWSGSIFFFQNNFLFLEVEFINPLIKNLPILLSFFNMFCFYLIFSNLYWIKFSFNKCFCLCSTIFTNISPFFFYAMFFNKLYSKIYNLLYNYSYLIQVKCVDKGLLEFIGPFGFYKFFRFLHINLNNFISPLLFNYLFIFFFNLFSFLIILFLIFNNYIFIFDNYIGLVLLYSLIIFIGYN